MVLNGFICAGVPLNGVKKLLAADIVNSVLQFRSYFANILLVVVNSAGWGKCEKHPEEAWDPDSRAAEAERAKWEWREGSQVGTAASSGGQCRTVEERGRSVCFSQRPADGWELDPRCMYRIRVSDLAGKISIYTVFHKQTTRYLIAHNFGKCWLIFKFSLSDSAVIV